MGIYAVNVNYQNMVCLGCSFDIFRCLVMKNFRRG